MNNDMSINRYVREMKETEIPEIDLSQKVMQKVYSYHDKHPSHKQKRFIVHPIWITACVLLFIATASVSASALFKTTWHGIEIKVLNHNTEPTKPANKDEPSYKTKLENALIHATAIWKTISLDDAGKQLKFTILRPQNNDFSLIQSFGVIPKDENYRLQSVDEWWLGGFYDIFNWNGRDIVVKQNIDVEMTTTLRHPDNTLSLSFMGAPWENLESTDNTLAFFTTIGNENFLLVKYKTTDQTVISLGFTGDMAKEDLLELARSYYGSSMMKSR